MFSLIRVHHIAVICSDYEKAKAFYIGILGLVVVQKIYRPERQSYKLDLALNDQYVLELFSFPDPPKRVSGPEATGLRHLAFEAADLDETVKMLQNKCIHSEPVRTDEQTGKRFTFIRDPDDMPIELYES